MKIEKIPTEKLIPYARNAKKHDAAQVSKLAGSIKEFGFNNPVLIDKDNGIIAGHGRVMAAQKLELKEVPCIRLDHLTDTQRRAYILADNRLSEIGGGWDEEMLKNELTSLLGDGVDISGLGWDDGWSEADGLGEKGEAYTRKVESPKYEPKKTKPSVPELFDSTKTRSMIEKIKKASISEDDKSFLIEAAYRHTVFNFENIAEYYAHSDKSVQELMEDSALVIIDFNKAIELGFVALSDGYEMLLNKIIQPTLMMKNENFVAFIMTHGRPDRVHTFRSLKKHGYTGKVVILIDNEDNQRSEYEKQFPGMVKVFDKKAISETFDEGDNFEDRRSIIYARNACFKVANDIGAKYFIQLDDDYTDFRYKTNAQDQYCDKINLRKLDQVFSLMVDFLEVTGACSVAMAQNGDFIGGKDGNKASKLKPWRKAMNTFVCSTDRPFEFFGRINEDVNTYTCGGRRGMLFFTIPNIAINQKQTQSNAGGMTELYLESGTYVKSFYSVMYAPSCVKIVDMGPVFRRMHHRVSWKHTTPCILDESFKK